MRSYHLKFSSKDKNSLINNFFIVIQNSIFNFNIIKKYFQKKTKRRILTILKSPHVNKSAQEKFSLYTYSKQLTIFPAKKLKYLYFLKKIKNAQLSNIKINIKYSSNKKKNKNQDIQIFNPNNFKLNLKKIILKQKPITLKNYFLKKQNKKKMKLFLQTIDVYGEFISRSSLV